MDGDTDGRPATQPDHPAARPAALRLTAGALDIPQGFPDYALDVGTRLLKSDRYLLLAECAQLDLIVRSGLLGSMLKNGYGFVNAGQQLRFYKPVKVFARVEVETRVLWFDQRWVYFQHDFRVAGELSARLLVKMKFKRGRRTIDPTLLLGAAPTQGCATVDVWNASLDDFA